MHAQASQHYTHLIKLRSQDDVLKRSSSPFSILIIARTNQRSIQISESQIPSPKERKTLFSFAFVWAATNFRRADLFYHPPIERCRGWIGEAAEPRRPRARRNSSCGW
jgi:hypothetical protein